MCHGRGASRALYHAAITQPSHACGVVLQCSARDLAFGRSKRDAGAQLWSTLGAYSGPWAGRSRSLQRHHTAHPITTCMPIASSATIRPGRLGVFPPARRDVHAGSSVVGGPWQANMLAPSLFAAYSMLRVLTGLQWRRRFWEAPGPPFAECVYASLLWAERVGIGFGVARGKGAKSSRP